jgi:diaminopimelate epimerase
MDGIGNDFVIVDLREGGTMTAEAARTLGDRAGDFGCDQIIGILPGPAMAIWNADGSVAGACGNAARCVASLLMSENDTAEAAFDAPGRRLRTWSASKNRFSVDMGPPSLGWQDIPLAEQMDDTRYIDIKLGPIDAPVLWGPSAVSMGNPHCVFFVPNVEAQALDRFGPLIEHHPLFPEGANVSVAEVRDRQTIRLRTWERGVGLTKACGTAACAALVSAVRRRLTEQKATIQMDGGELEIEWRADDHVVMTGGVSLNGQGVFGSTS